MSDHCKSCEPEWDDMVGLTSPENFLKGLAALVLCEGCGPCQVDPEGYCLGDCWGDYFTKAKHLCIHCYQLELSPYQPCPFHVGFFMKWWRRLFS